MSDNKALSVKKMFAADIKALPFDDATFDLATMSFAARNIASSR